MLVPDDVLEDYVREAGHLPRRTYEKRDISIERDKSSSPNSNEEG